MSCFYDFVPIKYSHTLLFGCNNPKNIIYKYISTKIIWTSDKSVPACILCIYSALGFNISIAPIFGLYSLKPTFQKATKWMLSQNNLPSILPQFSISPSILMEDTIIIKSIFLIFRILWCRIMGLIGGVKWWNVFVPELAMKIAGH